ncbi:MAG: peroxiredoxin family protein [Planctomycetota bacterium]
MTRIRTVIVVVALSAVGLYVAAGLNASEKSESTTPGIGAIAPDFTAKRLSGEEIQLAELRKKGPVVLVMLRGFPGYHCPICSKQVGELIQNGDKLEEKQASVVLIYPGPAKNLDKHAKAFLKGKEFPTHFHFVVDSDFVLTNQYGLRWDAPLETAYPATFVLDSKGTVKFVKLSRSHAGRASVAEILEAIP